MTDEVRLIDANDVIERLDMICDAGGCLSPVTKAVRSFCKGLINHQPTIEAEPVKHGRWMYPFYCSECGFTPYYSSDLTYNYCPNCGVRMDLKDGDGE